MGKSEFYGHSIDEQILRIEKGIQVFKEHNIKINTFFAPNHTYDLNTFKALKHNGIANVIDGYGLSPFIIKKDLKFIPQLFYKTIFFTLRHSINSTSYKLLNEKDFKNFEQFIKKNHLRIIDLDTACLVNNKNVFIKFLNIFIKPVLKLKRLIKS